MQLLAVFGHEALMGLEARPSPPPRRGQAEECLPTSGPPGLQGSLPPAGCWRRLRAGPAAGRGGRRCPGGGGAGPASRPATARVRAVPPVYEGRRGGTVLRSRPEPRRPRPARGVSRTHGPPWSGRASGQLPSHRGWPVRLRLEAPPPGARPGLPWRGREPVEGPAAFLGLSPDPASVLLPVAAPDRPCSPAWLQGAGECRETPDPGEQWTRPRGWPRSASGAHGHGAGGGAGAVGWGTRNPVEEGVSE